MDVAKAVEEAKQLLADGKDKKAAQLLTDAAYRTHDAELERQIRRDRDPGPREGRLPRQGPLDEIIRVADLRSQAA